MQVEAQPTSIVPPGEDAPSTEPVRWRLATRIAFRFAFVYFLLFTLYIPVHFFHIWPIPQLFEKYSSLWRIIVSWAGRHLLHIPASVPVVTVMPSASTDTTYHYVAVLCYLIFAAVATMVWSVLDRKRLNYEQLNNWFRLYLRFAAGSVMIHYGAAKVFPWQFGRPTLATLLEPFGNSSPMHLLWTFMGASPAYTVFGGLAEVLGGALLIIPRTETLGALVCIGAMSNVLMLNMGYDVMVKLLSLHLLLIAMVLVVPDLKRLANFFVFNRRVEPAKAHWLFRSKRINQIAIVAQIALSIVLVAFYLNLHEHNFRRAFQHRSIALYGAWSVEDFTVDGQVRPPLLTDPMRWQRIIVESTNAVTVQSMTDSKQFFDLHVDAGSKSFSIRSPDNWMSRADFTYENRQPDVLTLKGAMNGHQIEATLRRLDESHFILVNRGLHWINEYPFDQ